LGGFTPERSFMELPIFQVDAFTGHLFGGNPAAVVILSQWLPNEILQAIAAENNLADTAFVVPLRGEFGLRWFTPKVEVDMPRWRARTSCFATAMLHHRTLSATMELETRRRKNCRKGVEMSTIARSKALLSIGSLQDHPRINGVQFSIRWT
jgi:PhzF family phenazine biosynthesis protein